MRKELAANFTSSLISLSPASLSCLEKNLNSNEEGAFIFGGLSKDGRHAWVARGGALEVVSTATGQRIAAWCFGAITRDTHTVITCITETRNHVDKTPCLLVGLQTGAHSGMLCLFELKGSKLLKAIDIPYKVTSIEPITTARSDNAPILSPQLRTFNGMVAVGTHTGRVYLVDLSMDDEQDASDEVSPNSLCMISPRAKNVDVLRYDSMHQGRSLCMELDSECHSRGSYYYKKPDGTVIKGLRGEQVSVTCQQYLPQSGTLAVGFSFGCFQLWRLNGPVLEYSSRLQPNLSPLTHFAYQEPENDPRNFCYLWVTRGPLPSQSDDESPTSIVLFQLVYNKKTLYSNYGCLYEELMSVGPRFEHDLTFDPYQAGEGASVGSRVLACHTIENPYTQSVYRQDEDDSFEGSHGPDLSLCLFAWEAASGDPQSPAKCYAGLFDMNRWYHAQMPVAIRPSSSPYDVVSYFAFCTLEEVMDMAAPDNILSVHIPARAVTKFHSTVMPAPEQHFFPSSLSFDCYSLSETGVVQSKFLGVQRQTISELDRKGPCVLLDPQDFFNVCLFAGLLPRSIDISSATMPLHLKREALLSMALSHNMIGFLIGCVNQWADGKFSHAGLNLRFLLDWGWSKIGQIKESLDRLCVWLYDCSGIQVDQQTLQMLQQYQTQLDHMITLLQCLMGQQAPITEQGMRDLDTKVKVVTLVSQHLQIVLWFLTNGLLPENCDSEEEMSGGQYTYPAALLTQAFNNRRQELQKLHSDSSRLDVLMIDGLVDQSGSGIHNQWEKEGGNGLYPPPSLHALLNIYLLESVSQVYKQSIVLYLLLDLVSLLSEEQHDMYVEKWSRFGQAFALTQGQMKLVKGFWLLDHKDFDDALLVLLDPMATGEVVAWQHTRIIKAFLYQGHHKMALRYMRIKKPAMNTPEDVKLRLTVLLANGLVSEAFEYQRVCRDAGSIDDLLSHFFLGCQQTKMVDQLLQMPLTEDEERYLVRYLQESSEPNSAEVLLMYYLQRSRYVDAIRLNERLKHRIMGESDPAARERAAARNAIIERYIRVLPMVQRKLTFRPEQYTRKSTLSRREVTRPKPLSTVVNRARKAQVISHATLISAVLEKVREAKEEEEADSLDQSAVPMPDEIEPFVCTPVTPRVKSRFSDAAEVVFPAISFQDETEKEASPNVMNFGIRSPAKSPRHSMDVMRKRTKYYGAAALSLLQTPPVRRKTPTKHKQSVSAASTPQSILKVRHAAVLRSTGGATSSQGDRVLRPKQITNVLRASFPMATPPSLHHKPVVEEEEEDDEEEEEEEEQKEAPPTPKQLRFQEEPPSTPKQLRFQEPTPSPSPEEEKAQTQTRESVRFAVESSPALYGPPSPRPHLSPRSVRDRSPTPERKSPKMAARTDQLSFDARTPPMDEDYVPIDADITFNFERSRVGNDLEEGDDEPMELSHDTEPLTSPPAVVQSSDLELSPPDLDTQPSDDLDLGSQGSVGERASFENSAAQPVEIIIDTEQRTLQGENDRNFVKDALILDNRDNISNTESVSEKIRTVAEEIEVEKEEDDFEEKSATEESEKDSSVEIVELDSSEEEAESEPVENNVSDSESEESEEEEEEEDLQNEEVDGEGEGGDVDIMEVGGDSEEENVVSEVNATEMPCVAPPSGESSPLDDDTSSMVVVSENTTVTESAHISVVTETMHVSTMSKEVVANSTFTNLKDPVSVQETSLAAVDSMNINEEDLMKKAPINKKKEMSPLKLEMSDSESSSREASPTHHVTRSQQKSTLLQIDTNVTASVVSESSPVHHSPRLQDKSQLLHIDTNMAASATGEMSPVRQSPRLKEKSQSLHIETDIAPSIVGEVSPVRHSPRLQEKSHINTEVAPPTATEASPVHRSPERQEKPKSSVKKTTPSRRGRKPAPGTPLRRSSRGRGAPVEEPEESTEKTETSEQPQAGEDETVPVAMPGPSSSQRRTPTRLFLKSQNISPTAAPTPPVKIPKYKGASPGKKSQTASASQAKPKKKAQVKRSSFESKSGSSRQGSRERLGSSPTRCSPRPEGSSPMVESREISAMGASPGIQGSSPSSRESQTCESRESSMGGTSDSSKKASPRFSLRYDPSSPSESHDEHLSKVDSPRYSLRSDENSPVKSSPKSHSSSARDSSESPLGRSTRRASEISRESSPVSSLGGEMPPEASGSVTRGRSSQKAKARKGYRMNYYSPKKSSPSLPVSPFSLRDSPRRQNNLVASMKGKESAEFKTPPRPTRSAVTITPPTSPESLQASPSQEKTSTRMSTRQSSRSRSRSHSPASSTSSKGATSQESSSRSQKSSSGSSPVHTAGTTQGQESPLSKGSYMMSLRSGKKMAATSRRRDMGSVDIEQEEQASEVAVFSFSEPMTVDAPPDDSLINPVTPARPFVFSPPLTRTRSTRRSSQIERRPSQSESFISSTAPPTVIEEVETRSTSTRKTKVTKTKTVAVKKVTRARKSEPPAGVSDSPLNFNPVSPPEPETSSIARSTRSHGKKPGASKTVATRTAKGVLKRSKRQPKLW